MKFEDLNTYSSEEPEESLPSASTPDQIQGLLDVINEVQRPESEDLPDLSAVELRLEEANCYKALLRNSLFNEDAGPVAKRVEKKVREFVRNELEVLLGLTIREVPKESDFTPEEVKTLKMLLSRVISKPKIENKPKEPVVRQAKVENPTPSITVETKQLEPAKELKKATKVVKPKANVRKVQLPNGEIKELTISSQVLPPPEKDKRIPVNADQSAMANAQSANLNVPKSGLLGVLVDRALKS